MGRLDRVADLFLDTTLRISCEEKITHSGSHAIQRTEDFLYMYERRPDGRLSDYRSKWGQPETVVVPKGLHLYNAYFWIFGFHGTRQRYHRYKILGEETIFGRPAVLIQFEPIPPIRDQVNDWYGTAWVDTEDAQLLKVEALRREDYENRRRRDRDLSGATPRVRRETYEVRTFVTEFTVIKNKLRFPGRVEIVRHKCIVFGEEGSRRSHDAVLEKVEQTYKRYRFFNIQTEEEVQQVLKRPPDRSPH